jgi:hypothetical protein
VAPAFHGQALDAVGLTGFTTTEPDRLTQRNHPRRNVRTNGRRPGLGGAPVAAIVLPDGKPAMGVLARELETLEAAFGAKLIKLNYGLTERPERPVEVERVPDGELV